MALPSVGAHRHPRRRQPAPLQRPARRPADGGLRLRPAQQRPWPAGRLADPAVQPNRRAARHERVGDRAAPAGRSDRAAAVRRLAGRCASTLPDGTVEQLAPGATGASSVTFVNTHQLGVYRAEVTPAAGARRRMRPPLRRRRRIPIGRRPVSRRGRFTGRPAPLRGRPVRARRIEHRAGRRHPPGGARAATAAPASGDTGTARDEFWPLLVDLALIFLVAEWLVYERDGARRIGRATARTPCRSPRRRGKAT